MNLLMLLIRILATVLIGLVLKQKEFLSFVGIAYLVDIVYYLYIIVSTKGSQKE